MNADFVPHFNIEIAIDVEGSKPSSPLCLLREIRWRSGTDSDGTLVCLMHYADIS